MTSMTRRSLREARRPSMPIRRGDVARQVVVVIAAAGAVATAIWGMGAFGGVPIAEAQFGALAPDASVLAPAGPAFALWGPLYVLLVGYAVWQALPRQRSRPRHRSVGWWIAAIGATEALWIVTAQQAPLWLVVAVMWLLVMIAAIGCRQAVTTEQRRSPWWDVILVEGLFGLTLGWAFLAATAVSASAATLVAPGAWEQHGRAWALIAIAGVVVIGLGASALCRWRVSVPVAMGWGVVWVGLGRLTGQPADDVVGWCAVAAAAVLIVVPIVLRARVLLRA